MYKAHWLMQLLPSKRKDQASAGRQHVLGCLSWHTHVPKGKRLELSASGTSSSHATLSRPCI